VTKPRSDEPMVLQARDLGKVYRLWHGPFARLCEAVTCGAVRGHEERWALRHVALDIPRGAAVGLCGANGAGKSTLLKILSGTTSPSEGRFRCSGRVASLLELGTGFHLDFTGRENVALHGMLTGHSHREVKRALDEIIDFAELGDAIDAPTRTYSTGMGMRLGFAAAMGFDPEVLILDEVFAVGDMYFQKKCVDRLLRFKSGGNTLLFCSHGLYDLRQLCDSALWLESGSVVASGDSVEVTNRYATWQKERTRAGEGATESEVPQDWPRIEGIELLRAGTDERAEVVRTGENLELHLSWRNPDPGAHPIQLGVAFMRQDQTLCAAAGTHLDELSIEGDVGRTILHLPRLALLSGRFTVLVYLFDGDGVFRYQETALAHELVVEAGTVEVGLVRIEHRWEFSAVKRDGEVAA
jgi:ABC-type polysaccharide/polyol phosphate transport system ATPase subunit